MLKQRFQQSPSPGALASPGSRNAGSCLPFAIDKDDKTDETPPPYTCASSFLRRVERPGLEKASLDGRSV